MLGVYNVCVVKKKKKKEKNSTLGVALIYSMKGLQL